MAGDRILCEHCGYPLEGLDAREPAHVCPECGTPVVESLPDRRLGSPWQQRRGLSAWIATNWSTLRHPGRRFRTLRVEWRRGASLALANILVASIIAVAPWTGVLHDDPLRLVREGQWSRLIRTAAWVVPAQVLAVAALFALLTLLEWFGVRFWSRLHGRRLTADAAWQVCAHATVGWILASTGVWLMLIFYLNLSNFGMSKSFEYEYGGAFTWGLCAVGFFAGLLAFEALVYRGVIACRFANRPRATIAVLHRDADSGGGMESGRAGTGGNPARA